jgi:hypothetical protein
MAVLFEQRTASSVSPHYLGPALIDIAEHGQSNADPVL